MKLAIPSRNADWQDCHSGPVRADIRSAREAYVEGITRMPRWAEHALAMHNRIVGVFGLHTGGDIEGDLMASLPVRSETENAYECGLTDKHLTFTILTELKAEMVRMTTSIWFNHWSGRAYLGVVLVPHKIIVKQCINRLA